VIAPLFRIYASAEGKRKSVVIRVKKETYKKLKDLAETKETTIGEMLSELFDMCNNFSKTEVSL